MEKRAGGSGGHSTAMPVLSEQHLDVSFQSTLPLKACRRGLAVPSLLDVLSLATSFPLGINVEVKHV